MKYIFVSGGVISGIGKGTLISSVGVLLQKQGYRVTCVKIDPYLNIDSGLMNPAEHGEVFVLADGTECDLDLGCYERFMNLELTRVNTITMGKVMQEVLNNERRGHYLGKTVQIVPHVTDAIETSIMRAAKGADGNIPDICLVELGGTIGDIESAPFAESLRRFRNRRKKEDTVLIHVTMILNINKELKTKAAQHSLRTLMHAGLTPDIVVCRTPERHEDAQQAMEKVGSSANIGVDRVFMVPDLSSVYEVPLYLHGQGFDHSVLSLCRLKSVGDSDIDLCEWTKMVSYMKSKAANKCLRIGLVGKYMRQPDSYLSVERALMHAGFSSGIHFDVVWLNAESNSVMRRLVTCDGVIVLGGFGSRGVSGKIEVIRYCRVAKVPMLGLCLGFQLAVLERARNVLGIRDATSAEFEENAGENEFVSLIETDTKDLGGTMRLGEKVSVLADNTRVRDIYGCVCIRERHRHRYAVNPKKVELLRDRGGLVFSGTSACGHRITILEDKDHPFFIGTQFHPEYTSTISAPNPLFLGFLKSCRK